METTFNEVKVVQKGGFRPGAGRKPGSKNLLSIPKKTIMEYTSEQEMRNMVERAKKATRKSDKMLQWYLEMCLGKPKVVEREEKGKTTNNIAVFLDSLEKQNILPPISPDYEVISDIEE